MMTETDLKTDLFIGGAWRPASSGIRFPVTNPADESVIAEVASATVPDALSALDAAEAAFAGWAGRRPRERADILRRAFELMSARAEAFARLMTLENGKARADAMGEAIYSAEFFRWFSEEAVRIDGQLGMAPASGARIMVRHAPAGVAVLITPWNFPAAMGARKIAPALAAGCPVIVKPASETPLTMLALAALLEEAGVPPGVVNVIPSRESGKVVDALLADMRVRVVSFTGSTQVGRGLLKTASHNVVTPAMELGGNAPAIVFDDADLESAVEGVMLAKLRNVGEACTAANRIYLQSGIAEAFTARLTERMASLKVGNGVDPDIDIGPLVNAETRDKVAHFVDDAVAKGARCMLGGRVPAGPGYFYPPTVLADVPDNADCLHDEIFGPVAAIQTFTDQEDVIARANATEYGLVAYVFTGDLKRGLQVAEKLESGMVGINRGVVSDPAAPFGGVKQSGLGREGGHEGIFEFMETQYISVAW